MTSTPLLMSAPRILGFFAAACIAGAAQAASIKISCGPVGQELALCRASADAWARQSGHEVQVVATPIDSNERLALYQQVLGSQSDKIDVFQIDMIWPGVLAEHLHDLKARAAGVVAEHFPDIVANNTVGGRLVAMPWFADAGLLYYRRDLLEKHRLPLPATWEDLGRTALRIQQAERASGNPRMWGYVWQGRADESLTCNVLEWLVSYRAGSVVEADGRVGVHNPRSAKALQTAAGWVGRITPTAVLNHGEEESRGIFQAGNAVFMRNWAYAWSLAQSEGSVVRGKVGVAVLPMGGAEGRHAATLGGQQLAVSRYSRHPDVAADLVLYMTSAAVQKERAIRGSFNPTRPALYEDAEVIAANPFMRQLPAVLANGVRRPTSVTGSRYGAVGSLLWGTVQAVLEGEEDAEAATARLESGLGRLAPNGRWQ